MLSYSRFLTYGYELSISDFSGTYFCLSGCFRTQVVAKILVTNR
jgi:hypothetical protein